MRLIDADALKLAFENCEVCKKCPSASDRCAYECTEPDSLTAGIERVIDAQPTVDAVPIIRCKDCKFRCWDDFLERYCCQYYVEGIEALPDDFCSNAERKDGKQ
mgnify:CR=1 FL=1